MTLTWEKVTSDGGAPIEAYIIEAKKVGEKTFYELAKVSAAELSYAATGLQENQDYEFAVKAQNPAGPSQDAASLQEPVKTKPKIGRWSIIVLGKYQNDIAYCFPLTVTLSFV